MRELTVDKIIYAVYTAIAVTLNTIKGIVGCFLHLYAKSANRENVKNITSGFAYIILAILGMGFCKLIGFGGFIIPFLGFLIIFVSGLFIAAEVIGY